MQRFDHLASLEALSLFLQVNKHRVGYDHKISWTERSKRVQNYAPDWVKSFFYQDESCDCWNLNEAFCLDSTINYLDSTLEVNTTDVVTEYPREVLFVGYVLQSLKTGNLSQEYQQQIIFRETKFQATYDAVCDALISYFLLDDSATLYLHVSSLENSFKIFLTKVVKKAYGRDGISRMATFLYQSKYVADLGLKCDMFETLYKAMSRGSDHDSTSVFAIWLFIESYVLNSYQNDNKDMRSKCEKVKLHLWNTIKEHLDDFDLWILERSFTAVKDHQMARWLAVQLILGAAQAGSSCFPQKKWNQRQNLWWISFVI